jgi:hypothetical protein
MSTFQIREYWILLLYNFAKHLSIAGMCGCKVWATWHDTKYTAHLSRGKPTHYVSYKESASVLIVWKFRLGDYIIGPYVSPTRFICKHCCTTSLLSCIFTLQSWN